MPGRVRRGLARVVEEERAVGAEAQRDELRRQMDARVRHRLRERVVRGKARHQRHVDAEAREVGELEVEEAQVAPGEHRGERLDLRAEAGRHAAGEHDRCHLAARDRGAPEGRRRGSRRRAGLGQACSDAFLRYLDRLANAVQRLGVGSGGEQALPQQLERDALEMEALEQLRHLRRNRCARNLHHGPP